MHFIHQEIGDGSFQYLSEEMLNDCSQSLHSPVPLDKQLPQLVDGLVLLLCLLFALVLFSCNHPIRSNRPGHARFRRTVYAGSRFGAGA